MTRKEEIKQQSKKIYPKMSRITETHRVIPADNKSHYLGDANEEKRMAFIDGSEWADRTAWKPADGDNLPEIDREVIALVEEYGHYKVVFAHRPPEYWDGRNILTDEITRNYTKRYDKGEWNQPNVKWWLDLELPKMEE